MSHDGALDETRIGQPFAADPGFSDILACFPD